MILWNPDITSADLGIGVSFAGPLRRPQAPLWRKKTGPQKTYKTLGWFVDYRPRSFKNIKENNIEIFILDRQGLTLLLRISICNRESGLRSSL